MSAGVNLKKNNILEVKVIQGNIFLFPRFVEIVILIDQQEKSESSQFDFLACECETTTRREKTKTCLISSKDNENGIFVVISLMDDLTSKYTFVGIKFVLKIDYENESNIYNQPRKP